MAKLIWGDEAVSDLEGIYDYIARDSHQYARHQIDRIYQSVFRLQQLPESGRHLPEFPHLPHREVIVDNYRAIYRYDVHLKTVWIITVMHGRRLITEDALS